MPKFPYNFFDDFIVRLPHLSFKEFKRNFYEKCTDDENIEKYLTSIIFREAIYLASLSLYNETKTKINQKLKVSLLKYYNRASTRYTPFGLFAGVSLGNFDKENQKISNVEKDTELREKITKISDLEAILEKQNCILI